MQYILICCKGGIIVSFVKTLFEYELPQIIKALQERGIITLFVFPIYKTNSPDQRILEIYKDEFVNLLQHLSIRIQMDECNWSYEEGLCLIILKKDRQIECKFVYFCNKKDFNEELLHYQTQGLKLSDLYYLPKDDFTEDLKGIILQGETFFKSYLQSILSIFCNRIHLIEQQKTAT